MKTFKRRTWIKSIGALSVGIASPSLSKGEISDDSPIVTKRKLKTDILVIGGGTAGVIAAILAGREGCETILVENGSQLGGTTTTGGVTFPGIFHAWGKQIIKGIGWELVSDCVTMNGDKFPDFSIPHGKKPFRIRGLDR